MTLEESRSQKESWLRSRMSQWSDRIEPVRFALQSTGLKYRDKVCLAAEWEDSHWKIGVRQGNDIVPIHECPVHSDRVNKTVHLFLACLPSADYFPLVYFVQSGKQVTLVAKSSKLPDISWFSDDVVKELEAVGVEGVWIHLHPSAGKRIFLKKEWKLIHGKPSSGDGNGLLHGPLSFQQLIPELYSGSLEASALFLDPDQSSIMIDLYCGTGTSLNFWLTDGAATAGVELGGEAVTYARMNAPGAYILRGKCAERIPQLNNWVLQQQSGRSRRLLYVNPPRTGLEPEITDWIIKEYKPDRIAYLSCSAGTLSRDLSILTANGFSINKIIPYDFFPHTRHVECLVMISGIGELVNW